MSGATHSNSHSAIAIFDARLYASLHYCQCLADPRLLRRRQGFSPVCLDEVPTTVFLRHECPVSLPPRHTRSTYELGSYFTHIRSFLCRSHAASGSPLYRISFDDFRSFCLFSPGIQYRGRAGRKGEDVVEFKHFLNDTWLSHPALPLCHRICIYSMH